MGFAR
jgi:hypothetical protein